MPARKAVAGWAAALLVGLLPGVIDAAEAVSADPDATPSVFAPPSRLGEAADGQGDEKSGLRALPAYIRKRWGVDLKRAEEVVAAAQAAAAQASVDPLLLLAVIAKESKFRHFGNPKPLTRDARNASIDPMAPHGPMQIAGRWHRDKMPRDGKGRIRPTSLKENVVTGALVLRDYLDYHGGNLRQALQQYNGCRTRNCDHYPSQVLGLRRDLERAAGRHRAE